MLEVFFLISTIALLFESWWVFFILQAAFWFGYRPIVGNLNSLKFPWLDEKGQREALKYFGKMDMFANWISAGGHWDYQNVARKPRIVFEHYGRKSGKRFIAAAMPYNLADRHAAGVDGLIIAGSNQGFDNCPQWIYNLRDMASKGQLVCYNFGRTVYYAEICEITDPEVRKKLIPEMIKSFPQFAIYQQEAREHGRDEVAIFSFKQGAPGTGEYAWQNARKKRKEEEGYSGVMRPVMSPFWEKFWNKVGI